MPTRATRLSRRAARLARTVNLSQQPLHRARRVAAVGVRRARELNRVLPLRDGVALRGARRAGVDRFQRRARVRECAARVRDARPLVGAPRDLGALAVAGAVDKELARGPRVADAIARCL